MKSQTKILAGLGLTVLVAVGILFLPFSPLSLIGEGEWTRCHKSESSCYDYGEPSNVKFICDQDQCTFGPCDAKYCECVYKLDYQCDGTIDQTVKLTSQEEEKIVYVDSSKYSQIIEFYVKQCTSDSQCDWCGQKCYAEWNMPDACPTIVPPKGYECACNRDTGECEKKLVDADGDGVPDYKDDCPKTSANTPNGCPYNDQDADGVYDRNDKAPNTYGSNPDGTPTIIDSIVNFFVNIGLWSR